MTAQYHLAVVSYDSSAGHLITRACGDVKVSELMIGSTMDRLLIMRYITCTDERREGDGERERRRERERGTERGEEQRS